MMNMAIWRREFVSVDHSDVYYKNERLEDKMRRQVVSLSKDEYRSFLQRQSEIARVMEDLDKLQAFREPLKSTAAFRLAANLNYKYSGPTQNYVLVKLTNQEYNKTYHCPNSGPFGRSRKKNTAAIHRQANENISPSLIYYNKNGRALSKYSSSNNFDRLSPFDTSRPYSMREHPIRTRISASSYVQAKQSTPFFKTSSQPNSNIKGDSLILNKRPSSCKEQWAGLRDTLSEKRNSSVATNWSRFRSAKTTRNCTVVGQSKFQEALTLRRLREIYILEEPKVGISGNRRTNFVQNLLLLNQKRKETVQEKVNNFLLEFGEKQRKISVCPRESNSMINKRSSKKDARNCR